MDREGDTHERRMLCAVEVEDVGRAREKEIPEHALWPRIGGTRETRERECIDALLFVPSPALRRDSSTASGLVVAGI